MIHLKMLLAALLAIGLAVIYACGTTGEVGVGKDKGTGRIWFGANATWGVSGPNNMCGCLTWTDQNGKPLKGVGQAEIKNGSGGGTVPSGAKGWQIEIVPCSEFDGCDEPEKTAGAAGFRFYGVRVLGTKLLSFDVVVAGPIGAHDARDVFEAVLAGAPVAQGVHISDFAVATPRYAVNAPVRALDGFDVVVIDNEPILLSRLAANGNPSTTATGLFLDPDGYYRAPHFVPASDLDLSLAMAAGTHNVFSQTLRTAQDGVQRITLDLAWRP